MNGLNRVRAHKKTGASSGFFDAAIGLVALTATTVAAATTAATTATAWATRTAETAAARAARWAITGRCRTRFVNHQRAAFERLSVHARDRGLCALIGCHRDKRETTHTTGFAIGRKIDVGDFTKRTKLGLQHIHSGAEADIADKQTITHD
jgi:hypothetical protein